MAATLFAPMTILASSSAGGLLFAYENSTLPGKLVLAALFVIGALTLTVWGARGPGSVVGGIDGPAPAPAPPVNATPAPAAPATPPPGNTTPK